MIAGALSLLTSTASSASTNATLSAISQQSHPLPLPLREALSGIFGSISLTSWLCLLLPQLIENYRNQSAEALSVPFILIWFVGDVCNLFGGLWAGLVPVVIVVALYFCFSDALLFAQVLYYGIRNRRREGKTLLTASVEIVRPQEGSRIDNSAISTEEANENQPLLRKLSRASSVGLPGSQSTVLSSAARSNRRRRSSATSGRSKLSGSNSNRRRTSSAAMADEHLTRILEESSPETGARAWLKIIVSVLAVCAIGTAGWALAYESGAWRPSPPEPIGNGGGSGSGEKSGSQIAKGAQILGYASAVLYLTARIPQIIKNWREKSCEGLAILFFILSLLGNLTYGAGIICHSTERNYIIKNIPWLIGSLGTMVEDVIIFVQFRIYKNNNTGAGETLTENGVVFIEEGTVNGDVAVSG